MRRLQLLSFVIGAAAALVLLAAGRVPAGRGELGADLALSIGRSNVVELSRTGTVVEAARLRRGRTLHTAVVVHNPGPMSLLLRPQLQLGSGSQLAGLLHLEVRAGTAPVYTGTLSGLGRSSRTFRLEPRSSRRVNIAIGLPRDAKDGYGGRSIQASLLFEAAS